MQGGAKAPGVQRSEEVEHVEEGGKLHLKYQHSEDQLSNFLKTEVFVHLVTFLNPTAAK